MKMVLSLSYTEQQNLFTACLAIILSCNHLLTEYFTEDTSEPVDLLNEYVTICFDVPLWSLVSKGCCLISTGVWSILPCPAPCRTESNPWITRFAIVFIVANDANPGDGRVLCSSRRNYIKTLHIAVHLKHGAMQKWFPCIPSDSILYVAVVWQKCMEGNCFLINKYPIYLLS